METAFITKSVHTPLELAIRYAATRAHKAAEAVEFAAVTTLPTRRRNVTARIPDSVLARLQMQSAEGAWADGIREAA